MGRNGRYNTVMLLVTVFVEAARSLGGQPIARSTAKLSHSTRRTWRDMGW